MEENHGFISKLVSRFLEGPLAIMILLVAALLGGMALLMMPREEEPQIVVPVVDVLIDGAGCSADEMEKLAVTRLESILGEIPGVENIYSMSRAGLGVVTAKFFVGEDRETALTNVQTKIDANMDRVPTFVRGFLVKSVEPDDVPIVTFALYSKTLAEADLRRVAEECIDKLSAVDSTGAITIIGGDPEQVVVKLDKNALASTGLNPLSVAEALQKADSRLPAGFLVAENSSILIETTSRLRTFEDIENVVVGSGIGVPPMSHGQDARATVKVRDVATLELAAPERSNYASIGFGPCADRKDVASEFRTNDFYSQVTITVSKRKGSNAVTVAEDVIARMEEFRANNLPDDVHLLVTRNYGETANTKVNELIGHITFAIIIVTAILLLGMGWRQALVVAIAVPLTFALTLFVDMLLGFTINRVTLFALVLSLGLLVDDPIVGVENISRHLGLDKIRTPRKKTLDAMSEVLPPLVMATLSVIVSFVPMFFITGMMGPYMRPMAFNVPAVMFFSMLVSLTVTPWAAYKLLRKAEGAHEDAAGDRTRRWYSRIMTPLIESSRKAKLFLLLVTGLFFASLLLVVFGLVPLKMLPFDNKDEFLIVGDLPEGVALEMTDRAARDVADYLRTVPEVSDFEIFTGVASPVDFNGLVRHYNLRRGSNVFEIRVNLAEKKQRAQQTHALTMRIRDDLTRIAAASGVALKIVEVPPGPPVLSTLTAEVRGPANATYEELQAESAKVQKMFAEIEGVRDIDTTREHESAKLEFRIDQEKATMRGLDPMTIAMSVSALLRGAPAAVMHRDGEREERSVVVQLPREDRSRPEDVLALTIPTMSGGRIALSELGSMREVPAEQTIYHKDLARVVFVTAEMAGRSPVNAVLDAGSMLKEKPLTDGFTAEFSGEGEWKITVEVFRDLGIAFGVALLGIYILLLIQTKSAGIPMIMMAAIPITLIGIAPGFAALNFLGAETVGGYDDWIYFTATAMIGMIALAGIVVRNSIILIDFIDLKLKEGSTLENAVVEAGAVRLRPIVLTATTSLFGSLVMVLDPIFSGLAYSFVFGILASTAFSLVVIPLIYYLIVKRRHLPVT
ncbi:MAG: efflux RND transporter permease subunit [Planctomycetes bacterium]|nr:efflux RND transporter permease subunit [Planctomycetota bacterium]